MRPKLPVLSGGKSSAGVGLGLSVLCSKQEPSGTCLLCGCRDSGQLAPAEIIYLRDMI
jgi:hypothetical protein